MYFRLAVFAFLVQFACAYHVLVGEAEQMAGDLLFPIAPVAGKTGNFTFLSKHKASKGYSQRAVAIMPHFILFSPRGICLKGKGRGKKEAGR